MQVAVGAFSAAKNVIPCVVGEGQFRFQSVEGPQEQHLCQEFLGVALTTEHIVFIG